MSNSIVTRWLAALLFGCALAACGTEVGEGDADDASATIDAGDSDAGPCPEGQACDDGDPCTTAERCAAGKCAGGVNVCECAGNDDCAAMAPNRCLAVAVCDKSALPYRCKVTPTAPPTCATSAPCSVAACDSKTGACVTVAAPDQSGCDDGVGCTVGDRCEGGKCVAGVPVCDCVEDMDCASQGEANACLGALYCDKAKLPWRCRRNQATAVQCPNEVTACALPGCDPKTGECGTAHLADGTSCDDGQPCTTASCADGVCKAAKTDTCACASHSDCAAAEDGDVCNGSLYCDTATGSCQLNPATVVTCSTADDTACAKRVCYPKSGACNLTARALVVQTCAAKDPGDCSFSLKIPGQAGDPGPFPCEDGNPCTKGDVCAGAACKAGADACGCKADADCAAQEDGNVCNGKLFCNKQTSLCETLPTSKVVCESAGDTACTKAACSAASGTCAATSVELTKQICDVTTGPQKCRLEVLPKGSPAKVGVACEDGDKCTTGEVCAAGKCGGGTFTCTCKSDAECLQLDDGDQCNGTAFCNKAKGACEANSGAAVFCPTGQDTACQKNACSPSTGLCGPTATGLAKQVCGDGDAKDVCRWVSLPKGGAAKQVTCDDGNPCTNGDACEGATCKAGKLACACWLDSDCASKEDGNPCNGTLYCDKSGAKPACKLNPASVIICAKATGSVCLKPVCDPKTGDCTTAASNGGQPCDDGDPCTVGEACSNGACLGKSAGCNDDNACTVDTCDKKAGCAHKPISCDDGNACTLDVCAPATGKCSHSATPLNGALCNADGDGCTVGDTCVQGACKVGQKATCAAGAAACVLRSCQSSGPLTFSCVAKPVADGAPCTDPGSCFSDGACAAGKCAGGKTPRLHLGASKLSGSRFEVQAVARVGADLYAAGLRVSTFGTRTAAIAKFGPTSTPSAWIVQRPVHDKTAGFDALVATTSGELVSHRVAPDGAAHASFVESWKLDGSAGTLPTRKLGTTGALPTTRLLAQSSGGIVWLQQRASPSYVADTALTANGSTLGAQSHLQGGGFAAGAVGGDDTILVGGWVQRHDKMRTMAISRRAANGTALGQVNFTTAPRGRVVAIAARDNTELLVAGQPDKGPSTPDTRMWLAVVSSSGKVLHAVHSLSAHVAVAAAPAAGGAARILVNEAGNARLLGVDALLNPQFSRKLRGAAASGTVLQADWAGVLLVAGYDADGAGWTGRLNTWGHTSCGEAGACGLLGADTCDDNKPCTVDGCDGKKGCVHAATAGLICAGNDGCAWQQRCDAKAQCSVGVGERLGAWGQPALKLAPVRGWQIGNALQLAGLHVQGRLATEQLDASGNGQQEIVGFDVMTHLVAAGPTAVGHFALGVTKSAGILALESADASLQSGTIKLCELSDALCVPLDAIPVNDGEHVLAAAARVDVFGPTLSALLFDPRPVDAPVTSWFTAGPVGGWVDQAAAVAELGPSAYAVVGSYRAKSTADRDGFIVVVTSPKPIKSTWTWTGQGDQHWDAATGIGDDVLAAGTVIAKAGATRKLALARYNNNGQVLWSTTSTDATNFWPAAVERSTDGTITVASLVLQSGSQRLAWHRHAPGGKPITHLTRPISAAFGKVTLSPRHGLRRLKGGDWLAVGTATAAGKKSPYVQRLDPWGHASCSAAGKCAKLAATACDDDQACSFDACQAQLGCQHQTVGCDDGKACTADTCDAKLGCLHNAAGCDDNNPCTVDACADGKTGCTYAPRSCDDGDACTIDTCDKAAKSASTACQHKPRTCSDGDVCTTDTCNPKVGCAYIKHGCEDGNGCTIDSCDAAKKACAHVAAKLGAACDDNNPCTANDRCDGKGKCIAGSAPACADGNPCTADSCLASGKCLFAPLNDGAACDLGPCVLTAKCSAGKCSGKAKCDDGKPCTTDACDKGTCTHKAHTGACDDNDICTESDTCAAGKCAGKKKTCDDGDACTLDTCDVAKGCQHKSDATKPGCGCTVGVKSPMNKTADALGWLKVGPTPTPASPAGKGWQVLEKAPAGLFKSGPGVMYYGDSKAMNYDFGENRGDLFTPEFTPLADTKAAFWLYIDQESNTTFDLFQVSFYADSKYHTLFNRVTPAANGQKLLNTTWQRWVLPLKDFAGKKGRIVWTFYAKDKYSNEGKGAFLDDVEISTCAK